jgi:hypothetical protein
VWSSIADTITSERGSRLHWPAAVLDGSRSFDLDLGVTVVNQLDHGDQFGVELVGAEGGVAASCLVTCDAVSTACTFDLVPSNSPGVGFVVVPVTSLAMRRNPFRIACVFNGAVATDEQATMAPALPPVTVRLVGSPKVRFRYISIWQ